MVYMKSSPRRCLSKFDFAGGIVFQIVNPALSATSFPWKDGILPTG